VREVCIALGDPHTHLYDGILSVDWIHYINLRSAHGTQKEHMDIALDCKEVFKQQFPSVSEA
jgi:thymidylate synthase (FAD)